SALLRYRHLPHRQSSVGSFLKTALYLPQERLHASGLYGSDCLLIHPASPIIPSYPIVGLLQDRPTVYPVVERMKPARLTPFGTYPELPLKSSCFAVNLSAH